MRRWIVVCVGVLCLWGTAAQAQPVDPRSERGLTNLGNLFVPKGQWIAGLGASYSTHDNNAYSFLIIEGINSEGYTVKVTPLVAYALWDNMAIGAKFTYSRAMQRIRNAEIALGGDLALDYYYTVQHDYSMGVIWRQYIPLGHNKRFALFNEVQLSFGGGESQFAMDEPIHGTYQKQFSAALGISPGLIAFATNNLAFEVNIGMMGISYSQAKQVHNQVTSGKRSSSGMNFRINPLAIGLGVSFYL